MRTTEFIVCLCSFQMNHFNSRFAFAITDVKKNWIFSFNKKNVRSLSLMGNNHLKCEWLRIILIEYIYFLETILLCLHFSRRQIIQINVEWTVETNSIYREKWFFHFQSPDMLSYRQPIYLIWFVFGLWESLVMSFWKRFHRTN